jgi:Domain of unknown function (DUF4359)
MYQPARRLPLASRPFPRIPAWLGVVGLLAGAAATTLVWTNPGPEEFEAFAGDQLAELAVREVCRDQLPMPLRMVLRDCPELVRAQRRVLGALARRSTTRTNFGLFSLYRTEIGGPDVLPFLNLPLYRVETLAGAGHFRILRTSSDREEEHGGPVSGHPW